MKKCIIVDDVALNIVLAQKMLTSLKLDMSKAVNGQQACDMIRNGYEPDVMILDLMMPIMDGFQVLEEIRSGKCGNKDLPIIILSALNREEDVNRAMSLGANDFVTKPIIMNRLITAVKNVLGEQES
ncbi:MAG: response regulator [Prevotella sp.]|jgi:CheY-like chemotaxis protein|nr:response regulator [Prevotella sp.]